MHGQPHIRFTTPYAYVGFPKVAGLWEALVGISATTDVVCRIARRLVPTPGRREAKCLCQYCSFCSYILTVFTCISYRFLYK